MSLQEDSDKDPVHGEREELWGPLPTWKVSAGGMEKAFY